MDITFLIGNGFDISLGYKTSYKDFYQYYLKQPNNSEYENAISRLKVSISDDIKSGSSLWSDFEIGLGAFTQFFGSDEANLYVDAYMDAAQKLHDYLSSLSSTIVSEDLSEKDFDLVRKNLSRFYQEANPQEKTDFSNLMNSEKANGWESSFHFVSFNYTSFLDDHVTKLAQKPLETWNRGSEVRKNTVDTNVLHVHGQLNDYPVLGLSSEDQILNPDLRKNDDLRSALIKNNIESVIGYPHYSELKELINKSRIICLFGLSLGNSDKHWWDYINKWLKADSNRSVFIFEHTDNPPSRIHPQDYRRKVRKVIFRLLNHSGFSEQDKNALIPRVHVIFNTRSVLAFFKNK
jgi:hypothetical protein